MAISEKNYKKLRNWWLLIFIIFVFYLFGLVNYTMKVNPESFITCKGTADYLDSAAYEGQSYKNAEGVINGDVFCAQNPGLVSPWEAVKKKVMYWLYGGLTLVFLLLGLDYYVNKSKWARFFEEFKHLEVLHEKESSGKPKE